MQPRAFRRFQQKNQAERLQVLREEGLLTAQEEKRLLAGSPLSFLEADRMVEHVIGSFGLPLGLATNFHIDGEDYVLPMVIEEASVIKAASFAAQLAKAGGGFQTDVPKRLMEGQITFTGTWSADLAKTFQEKITQATPTLLQVAREAFPDILNYGGGPQTLTTQCFQDKARGYYTLYLTVDTQEAMGANMINTMLEAIQAQLEADFKRAALPLSPLFAIISNHGEKALATARCQIPYRKLKVGKLAGSEVAKRISQASAYAKIDPKRAVTHNKGIMNGVDALVLATGNDWRAIEAGVHAAAVQGGHYQGLGAWTLAPEIEMLQGELTLPLPVGTLGGSINSQPGAQLAFNLLGRPKAQKFMGILAALGLAQNLAALRALVSEGIQAGHMPLQKRQKNKP